MFRLSLSDETAIASILDDVAQSFSEVQVGSYPVTLQDDGAHILVTLDSKQVRYQALLVFYQDSSGSAWGSNTYR